MGSRMPKIWLEKALGFGIFKNGWGAIEGCGMSHLFVRVPVHILAPGRERNDMPGIKVRDGEPIDKVLRIFKKQVEKAGVIGDLKKNQHYEKPSVKLKKKAIAARKRRIKQLRKMGRGA